MTSFKSMMVLSAGFLLLGTAVAFAVREPNVSLAVSDIEKYVFVPSLGSADITVIDSRNNSVVGTIDLDEIPDRLVVSSAVGQLIVSNLESRTVTLIDIETGDETAEIALDITPQSLVMSPEGYLVAVSDVDAGVVAVISLHRGVEVSRIDNLSAPSGLTFSDDGSLLYVPDGASNSIKLIDIVQGRAFGELPLSAGNPDGVGDPEMLSAVTRSANGRFGFCAIGHAEELAIFDFGTEQRVKTLKLGNQPSRPFGTADGRYIMVANNGDRTVSIIDTQTFDIAATLPGAADVTAINTGWFETVAFVISESEDKAIILDLMDLRKSGEIELPSSPGPGVVTPDAATLYVALSDTDSVAVIDTRSRRVTAIIDNVGTQPRGATMARTNNYCH